MEFGEPTVTIGEPRAMPVPIPGVEPRSVAMRSTVVHGEWHLWIYCCEWRLAYGDLQLAHCESDDDTIDKALHVLNGQALTQVEVRSGDGQTRFHFDLGCVLSTKPAPPGSYSEEPVEQWMLYEPDGRVLTIRGDGHYSHESGGSDEPDTWYPVLT
jgi:hypothetical protein